MISPSSRKMRLFLTLVFSFLGMVNASYSQSSLSPCQLTPLCAPGMALEAVASGTGEGTAVSIGSARTAPNQQWIFTPKSNGYYSINPAHAKTMVLSAAEGGKKNGTPLVLEADHGVPWQLWQLIKNNNGTYTLTPKYAPNMALDDFGGHKEAGAMQDIWDYHDNDPHVQWKLSTTPGQALPTAKPPAPEGTIRQFIFDQSRIFPGTTREVTVFIPAQYDGSKPACLYVRQDGYNPGEKPLLEKLIANQEIPVLIGVFVKPGILPAPEKGQFGRANRGYEYDGVGDRFARFINDEILPFAAQKCGLKFSADPNDRCIAGASSGGISAFNAAWERPDLFRRVYAISGSFVAFRGGHELPTLVRKCEPKPLRVYLTTATHDMENCAGDWFLLDQEMDKALTFSGYDHRFVIVDGKHCAGGLEHFCDAMRFVWKGWPAPVTAPAGAPRLRDVLQEGAGWEAVAGNFQAPRGPACNSKGEVFFVDVKTNQIHRIGLKGKTSVFVADAAHASSLFAGPKDELYSVSETTGNILLYDARGHATQYAKGVKGSYGLALPGGGIYISQPGANAEAGSRLCYLKDGQKTEIPLPGVKGASGLALRPDQWLLAIGDSRSKWVHSAQIRPDGSLMNMEAYFWMHVRDWEDDAGVQSVCYSLENRLLNATRFGIQICAHDGPTQVILPTPDRGRAMGVCLGGPKLNTLFIFEDGKIWKRTVKLHGTGPFSPAHPMHPTPL